MTFFKENNSSSDCLIIRKKFPQVCHCMFTGSSIGGKKKSCIIENIKNTVREVEMEMMFDPHKSKCVLIKL